MTPDRSFQANLARRLPFFYGWVVVGVCFVVITLLFAVRLSFGLFFDALIRSGEFNWSRGSTAGVFSLSMIIATLGGMPTGWLLDRYGARKVFTSGLCLLIAGLVLTSRIRSLREFYLAYGVLAGLGITILSLPVHATTISRWFSRTGRRGLAIGLAFSGTGIGVLTIIPFLERVITRWGWREGYLLLAALLGGIALPITLLFLRNHPSELGLSPDGAPSPLTPDSTTRATPHTTWHWHDAVQTPAFWLLLLAGGLSLFSLRMVTVHQIAYFVDRGFSRQTAATIFGGSGLITGFSFIFFGRLSDSIGRERAFMLGTLFQVLAFGLLLIVSPRYPVGMLYLYAVCWGLGEGSRSGLLTAIASDTFPGPAIGAIVGSLGATFALGAALGSWVGGVLFDMTHTYTVPFSIALGATVLATLTVWAVKCMAPTPTAA